MVQECELEEMSNCDVKSEYLETHYNLTKLHNHIDMSNGRIKAIIILVKMKLGKHG